MRSFGGWSTLKSLRKDFPRVKGDERILGRGEFVERVLKGAAEALAETTRLKREGISWESLTEQVMREHGLGPERLTDGTKDREAVRARRQLCYQAVRRLRMTAREVALKLRITPSAVSKLVSGSKRHVMGG